MCGLSNCAGRASRLAPKNTKSSPTTAMSSRQIHAHCRSCGYDGNMYPWYEWDQLSFWKQFLWSIVYDLPGSWIVLGGHYKCPECSKRQAF